MNILVIGERRFRIVDTHEHEPYRTGRTCWVSDLPAPAETVIPLADEVQKLLRDFLARSLALAGQRLDLPNLPDEPEQLSFTVACVLPLDGDEKQSLLEETDTAARLISERDVLLREVARLRRVAAARSPEPIIASRFATLRCRN